MAIQTILLVFTTLYIVFKLLWAMLRRYMIKTTTVLFDLKNLNLSKRSSEQKIQGTAVIAGGSIGGFVAARILTDYFNKVIIIDTDPCLVPNNVRVGQRSQLHFILPITLRIMRILFPDFDQHARNAGITIRVAWQRWHVGPSMLCGRLEQLSEAMTTSRLTLEILVRRLVLAYAGSPIEVMRGTVISVQASQDGARIDSVTLRLGIKDGEAKIIHQSTATMVKNIETSLFVDCSGSSSISVKMLPAAGVGWGPFQRHHYDPVVSYRTALVTVPENVQDAISRSVPEGDIDCGRWDQMTFIDGFTPTPETGRDSYVVQKVDGDRLALLHSGWGVDCLARNFSQFVEAVQDIQARTVGSNTPAKHKAEYVFDLLRLLESSIDDIDNVVEFVPFKMGDCQYYDFETACLPTNFVCLGDARMRVNPCFGQGVTKVITDITYLNSTLANLAPPWSAGLPAHFSKEFLKRAEPSSRGMYDINRMLDYGYNTTIPQAGESLKHGAWFRNYWNGLLRVCRRDENISTIVLNSLSGVAPGLDLFHPLIATKVLLELVWPSMRS